MNVALALVVVCAAQSGSEPPAPDPAPATQPAATEPPTTSTTTAPAPPTIAPPSTTTPTPPPLTPAKAGAPNPRNAAAPTTDESLSLSLDALGVEVSWSGYGDATVRYQVPDQLSFKLDHFNFIPLVRLDETVWLDMELEIEDAARIDVEFAEVLWQPSPLFRLSAGKLLVPIGRYSPEYHPSFRWPQVSEPLMMSEIIPSAWSEVGVGAGGTVETWTGGSVEYNAYVTNGAALTADQEHAGFVQRAVPVKNVKHVAIADEPAAAEDEGGGELRTATHNEPIVDNNLDKALGARLTFAQKGAGASAAVGLSGYTAALDAAQAHRVSVVDVDVEAHLGAFTLRGEAAQTFLSDYLATRVLPLESGAYVQLVLTAPEFLQYAARFDVVDERPDLGPTIVVREAVAGSVSLLPFPFLRLRAELFVPLDAHGNVGAPQLLGMVAWSF